jgi:hypothetical protein
VEIGTEAAQFPEKEYINGIFLAVHDKNLLKAFTPGHASSLPIYGSPARGTEFYK